jgi:hypothetical protein
MFLLHQFLKHPVVNIVYFRFFQDLPFLEDVLRIVPKSESILFFGTLHLTVVIMPQNWFIATANLPPVFLIVLQWSFRYHVTLGRPVGTEQIDRTETCAEQFFTYRFRQQAGNCPLGVLIHVFTKRRASVENRLVLLSRTRGLKMRQVADRFCSLQSRPTRVYPKVSGLAAWSDNCKWYSSLPLSAFMSLFCESV